MKKILLMLALFSAVVTANAQIATENSNALDNIGVGATFGATTPLDLNSMFPVNTTFGILATKGITPVFGAQVELITALNDNHIADAKPFFKNLNLGVNGALNLSNLIGGYIGRPRTFEVSAIGGMGWFSTFGEGYNNVSVKTGTDLAFNFGKKKAHSLVITPSIYWLLRNNRTSQLQLNKKNAVISLMASYVYHFKNSNGTHHFKTYDVGAMNDEINFQRGRAEQAEADLNACLNRRPIVVEKKKTQVINKVVAVNNGEWTVEFEQGKADLSTEAMATLDAIGQDIIVDVIGTASPEGTAEFNQMISEKRAATVADYLTKRGVKVNSWKGIGVQLNRLAIVKAAK